MKAEFRNIGGKNLKSIQWRKFSNFFFISAAYFFYYLFLYLKTKSDERRANFKIKLKISALKKMQTRFKLGN